MTKLEEIEIFVADEATIEFAELCGPNSLEFDLGVDDFVDGHIDRFHTTLYQSILGEFA